MGGWRTTWEKNAPDLHAALRGGFPRFVLGSPEANTDGIPVFCYHTVTKDQIEADLAFLNANGYRTLTADALMEALRGEAPADDHAVVLTVDDAAFNLYDVMFPALRKHGAHAVAFAAPAFHEDHVDARWGDWRPCTWAELAEMQASGHVNVQSHTWAHRFLPRWPEPSDLTGIDPGYSFPIQTDSVLPLRDDLERARQTLEDRLGHRVVHLAFPRYTGTDEAIRIGRELGYEGFWWGTLPGRRANRQGDPPDRIVRISGEFVRRLPGTGRGSLREILRARWRRRTRAV